MILALFVVFIVGAFFGLVTAALLASSRSADRTREAFRLGVRVGSERAVTKAMYRPRTMRAA